MNRIFAAVLAGISVVVILALVVITVRDIDQGVKVSTIVAAIIAVLTLVASVAQLLTQPPKGTAVIVRASGSDSMAAGGSITGNAVGNRSRVKTHSTTSTGPTAASQDKVDITVEGPHSVASGGLVSGNAFGEEAEVDAGAKH